jgi:hypothetical protein
MSGTQPATRLLYTAQVSRWRSLRRFVLGVVTAAALAGAAWAVNEVRVRGLVDIPPIIFDLATLVAILLAAIAAVRAGLNLWRFIFRPSVTINVYDQGILWKRGGQRMTFRWKQLQRYRVGRGRRTLEFLNDDKQNHTRLDFTRQYGNPDEFGDVVAPYAAYVTSKLIAESLRHDRAVRLHPKLTIYPGGIEARNVEIPWSDLDVAVKGSRLVVSRRDTNGRFRVVKRYATTSVDNVGGFMEVIHGMLPQHQPERFRRQTPVR